jgi:dTMP kinase
MKKGHFITFEGSDGCGKTTQTTLLVKKLKENGFEVVHTREPGGTMLAEAVRRILLHPESRIAPVTELLLYEACRYQHTDELILPSLKAGKFVICERYTDATVAYQGFGRGIDKKIISQLNSIATSGTVPDLTVFFDSDINEGLSRAHSRGKDRLENEDIQFHHRVRDGYLWLAKKYPRRIKIIKSFDSSIEEISERVFKIVAARFRLGVG